jgi:DNA polymerase-4
MTEDTPITTSNYPRAIIHLDADAFFASVEQALVPELRDKPVVTGKERGIIACANYQAKALGIKRGIPLFKARQLCPKLIILPNDYETYSLYSKRMFNIMRRYTPIVEEYSIDEAFADLTGLRRTYHGSYEDIALMMKKAIYKELGITVSVGLSSTKALAKICSKFRKPNGFTGVPGRYIHHLLQRTPLETVWGFGPNTVELLKKYGMRSAYDYVCKPERWARRMLHKPGRELWNELRGNSVWPVTPVEKSSYATILKSKTFTPASADRDLVYAKLVRNVESAFMKARRYRLRPKALGIVLRHHDFRHDGLEARLNRPSSSTLEILPLIEHLFEKTFRPGSRYRSTMVILGQLESDISEQYELFEDRLKIDSLRCITETVDDLNHRYGKHTVRSGTSLYLPTKPKVARDDAPARRSESFKGETPRQRLAIPRLSIRV